MSLRNQSASRIADAEKAPKPTQTTPAPASQTAEKTAVRPPSSATNSGLLGHPPAASSTMVPSVQEALAAAPSKEFANKFASKARFKLFNIAYDTDGETIDGLPEEIFVDVDEDCNISLEGADMISDQTGWCVKSFSFVEIEKNEEGIPDYVLETDTQKFQGFSAERSLADEPTYLTNACGENTGYGTLGLLPSDYEKVPFEEGPDIGPYEVSLPYIAEIQGEIWVLNNLEMCYQDEFWGEDYALPTLEQVEADLTKLTQQFQTQPDPRAILLPVDEGMPGRLVFRFAIPLDAFEDKKAVVKALVGIAQHLGAALEGVNAERIPVGTMRYQRPLL